MSLAAVPAIYGTDLPEPVRLAYGRWIIALCDRVEHAITCPFGCQARARACVAGRAAAELERERWEAWRAVLAEEGDDGC